MRLRELQQNFIKKIQQPDPQNLAHNIYHDSSLGARLKALRNVFPCCERLVGEDFFRQMTTEFLQQPSSYLTADAQAQDFAEFVAQYQPAASLPYLADMAKLEWCWYQVFHGPEGAAGAKIIKSNYPITQIWEMCQPEYQGDFVLMEMTQPLQVQIIQENQRIYIKRM